jgi:hypothetical protein
VTTRLAILTMSSAEFARRFSEGELGDGVDFFE